MVDASANEPPATAVHQPPRPPITIPAAIATLARGNVHSWSIADGSRFGMTSTIAMA